MQLIINRGETVLLSQLPSKSIALDGYVQGPELDLDNERISFDHHDKVIRLITSATCRQVLDALLLGFDPSEFSVYINDVDGDTSLAYWLLLNPQRAQEQRVRLLVDVVASMDAHGPAYPTLDAELCSGFYDRAMAPERDARRNKTYGTCDLRFLLAHCVEGITALVDNHAGKIEPKAHDERSYIINYTGNGWVLAQSDSFIFDLLYRDGYRVAVAFQEMADGSYAYTIAKKSDLVSFPVGPHSKPGTVLYALAQVEPGWGGGSSLGGAPRNADGSRSKLNPARLIQIIKHTLEGVTVAHIPALPL
jgi:hypothetical protein